MRVNEIMIQECPKFLTQHPDDTTHTLQINQDGEELTIPLTLRGVVSYLSTRKPTMAEYQTCRRVELTSEEPEWDPSSITFQDQEDATVDAHGWVHDTGDRNGKSRRIISSSRMTSSVSVSRAHACDYVNANSQCSTVLTEINPKLHEDFLLESLEMNVKVSAAGTGKRKHTLSADKLAKNWAISLDAAKQTLDVTTQRGVRTVANPSLSRRFRTNDRQLRYRRLCCNMYTDTLDAKTVVSKRGNKYAQIFCDKIRMVSGLPNQIQGGCP
jgi:hypothetical protein